jgi:hypothetical protein
LSLRSTSADLNMDFSNWSQEWAPDQRPQWSRRFGLAKA